VTPSTAKTRAPSAICHGPAVLLLLLLLLALAVLVPLLWLVSTSLKGPEENIFTSPPALLPSQPSLSGAGGGRPH